MGVHKMLMESVNACDIDVRKDLLNNLVLSGGTTMVEGIAARCGSGTVARPATVID